MNKLNFIHITKTGGTTIEDIACIKKIYWGKYNKLFKTTRHCEFINKLKIDVNEYNWFTVVRNPYTRIISEIGWVLNKNQNGFKTNKYVVILNNFLQDINEDNIIIKINNFLSYILDNYIDYENGDHFTPQYLYFDNNFNIKILYFENLENDFNNLMIQNNINLKISTNNNQNKNKYKDIFNIKDINDTNLHKIKEIYKKDFLNFNYEINIEHLLNP